MAGEKSFENRLKKWLESEGIYPLGEPVDRMSAPPCGFYEKRWGGSRYVKSGLPDMRITVKGIALEVELKATDGTPSVLQKRNLAQINGSQGFGFILYPEGFEAFKTIVKGVKQCEFPIQIPLAICGRDRHDPEHGRRQRPDPWHRPSHRH